MLVNNRSIFKPRTRGSYKIENKAPDEATVYIYDEIGWFGINAERFVKDFNAITVPTIHVRINSPGGAVMDGTAIYNVVKQHKSRIIVHIDGLAASIASIIALAADEVKMAENAFFMIHEPFSIVVGTAQDMRDASDMLDKVAGTIAKIYMNKTGKKESEILDLMAAETWMTAEEALNNGFIDKIEDDDKKAKTSSALFDLSAYAKVPDVLKNKQEPPIAENKEPLSARELEHILHSGGVSIKQAKAILSEGYKEELRDAVPPVEDLRDVDIEAAKSDTVDDLRDVEPPKIKDRVAELMIRAERIAPSLRAHIGEKNSKEYCIFLQ